MASNFPGGLDSFTTRTDGAGQLILAAHMNGVQDAIVAVETELGTDPAGASATVKDRLDALDTAVAGKAATAHNHAAGDINSGTVATARLGSGTASSTTYLRGDQTWATPAGGGGDGVLSGTTRAWVYQLSGNTIARGIDGTVISQLATTAANNVTVIQAAIDAVFGTYSPGTLTTLGFGGGGTVELSDQLYEVSAFIDVKWGVSLLGHTVLDRNGFTAAAHSFGGTILAPTSGLATVNVAASGAAVNRRPVVLLGRTQAANGTQSTTNPHGVRITGIGIDMRRNTTAQGILICDTQFVTVSECVAANATGTGGVALEIVSTNSPDDGAHGNDIRGNLFVNCEKGIVANGSGSTDSLISDCRVLQMSVRTIEIGAGGGGGGWQVSGCHLTTATTNQTGATDCHIFVSGAPCMITGNYFDTTGGYSLYVESPLCVVNGNYFKHSGTKKAPILLTATGRKSVIVGNTAQGSSSCLALVEINSTTGVDYRPTIMGNVLGDGGNASIIGIACTSAGAVISETNAAMTIARDGSANPFIWGNRIVESAV